MMRPLRTCRVCGFEVYTVKDLELFVKCPRSLHGREPRCKNCQSKYMKEHRSRTAEFVEIFRARPNGLRCHFCGEEIITLKGSNSDSLVIHSLDENHENWSHDNKVPTHRGCHVRFHHFRERSPNWKGDAASNSAKSHRRETKYAQPVQIVV